MAENQSEKDWQKTSVAFVPHHRFGEIYCTLRSLNDFTGVVGPGLDTVLADLDKVRSVQGAQES